MSGVLMPSRRTDTGLLATVLKGLAIAKDIYGIYTDNKQNELAEQKLAEGKAEKDRQIANEPVEMSRQGMVVAQEGEPGAVEYTGADGKKSYWKKAPEPPKGRKVVRQIANVNKGGQRGALTTWDDGTEEFTPTMDPTPAPQRPTLITTIGPDGEPRQEAVVLEPGKSYGKPGKEPNEAQASAARHAKNALEANAKLEELEAKGYEPASLKAAARNIPGLKILTATKEDQLYNTYKRNFINATLRKDTGASITESEWKFEDERYFPQPGDTPETVEEKRKIRGEQIQALVDSAGPRAQTQQGLAGSHVHKPGDVVEVNGKKYRVAADGDTLEEISATGSN
jgi:hypothetical protein